jgi:hypothetical protein
MTPFLAAKISTVRSRYRSVALGTGASLATLTLIVCFVVGILLDWWLDLPRFCRAMFLALDVILVGAILFQQILQPLWRSPDDDDLALRVEGAHPKFESRLIAAVQLSRLNDAAADEAGTFIRATVQQAEIIANGIDFPRVIPADKFTKFLLAGIIAVLVAATLFVAGWKDGVSRDLVARAFLSDVPVPRKTRVNVTSGDMRLGRGDSAVLSATARGEIPTRGKVEISFTSGRAQSFAIDPTVGDKSVFERKLDNVQDSFDYRIKLGDNTTRWFHAEVLPPPVVTKIEVTQIYPEYTHLPPTPRALGDLSILAGSRLLVKAASNNVLQQDSSPNGPGNAVHLVSAATQPAVRMNVDANDPHRVSAEVPIAPKTTAFYLMLRDTNGLTSKDPAIYRLDVVPDKPPTVKVTFPTRREELVTRIATVLIGFDAADDFGIAKLALKYKIDDGPEESIPLEIAQKGNTQPTAIHARYTFKLSKLTPPSATQPTLEGSTVEYWLEAEDNNTASGPGRGTSEHYSAKVVTEAEKKAEIFARFGASYQDIEHGTEQEEKLHKDLGDVILEKQR